MGTSSCFHVTQVEEIKRIVGEAMYENEVVGPNGSPVSGGLGSRATPSAAYLFMLPGKQFATSGAPKDVSNNLNDAAFGVNLSDASCWANAGYITTTAGTQTGITIPPAKTQFDLGSQSVLFSARINIASPAGNQAMFGPADASASQGFYISVRAGGKIRPVINTSGGAVTGLADSAATFADGTDHVMTVAIDAVTKQVFVFYDGCLSNVYAANFSGTSAAVALFAIGASSGGGTAYNGKYSGLHLLRFNGGLPLNLAKLAVRLAALPHDFLCDSDLVL